jgi:hypothetical protein
LFLAVTQAWLMPMQKKLDKSQIVKGIDGENWLFIPVVKKQILNVIFPLLPVAQGMLLINTQR